jgi:ferredoxin
MKTVIYYYTGTGNSLWTARLLATELGNAGIYPITKAIKERVSQKADAIGIVFPVHMWGIPGPVIQFLKTIKNDSAKYYFAFAVNAGQVSRTLIQLKKLMRMQGLLLSAGFDIVLPSNYIPWGGPGPADHLQKLYYDAKQKIKEAAAYISGKKSGHIEKGPLWQRILLTALYKMTYNMIPKMDKNFRADEKCNGCGICAKVCPAGNIVIEGKKPAWQRRCEQCLACIQWCPQEAIQYGKKTPAYERYHHPEIKLKDMIIPRK